MSTGICDESTNMLHGTSKLEIHDIPPELWAAIFKEVVTSDEDISLSSPMLFLRICHLWREIALTTPQLWTELYIGADTATQQTDLYLQKSMPLPIEISIDLLDSYRQAPVAVELLPAQLHRIRCLDIRANYLFDAQQVASIIGQNQVAPALQTLSVTIIREPSIIMPGTEAGFVTFKSPFSAVPVLDTLLLHLCHLTRNRHSSLLAFVETSHHRPTDLLLSFSQLGLGLFRCPRNPKPAIVNFQRTSSRNAVIFGADASPRDPRLRSTVSRVDRCNRSLMGYQNHPGHYSAFFEESPHRCFRPAGALHACRNMEQRK
ncbi:hypothetical protein CPC08DRAFT_715876 [Agrocybe pediades]|nr:hypothetical protein CPC08DRAFT_715876 [Agrocybe pediades]